MKKTQTSLESIQLAGIKVRTSFQELFNPETQKIAALFGRWFTEQIPAKIPNRKNPGVIFCAYTEYETDHTGAWTCFIGEAVTSLAGLPAGLETLAIPAGMYAKFTTEPGPMPAVVFEAWQQVWKISAADFGGQRNYRVDFEIYDERAQNPAQGIADLFIGIENR